MLPSIYCYNWKVDAKSFETFEENYQKLFLLYGFNKFDFINERDGLSDTQVIIMSNNKINILKTKKYKKINRKERDY